jgi:hypothetical protein
VLSYVGSAGATREEQRWVRHNMEGAVEESMKVSLEDEKTESK